MPAFGKNDTCHSSNTEGSVDPDLDSSDSAVLNPRKPKQSPQKGKVTEIQWYKKVVVLLKTA
jgi:hypothetical protein